MLHNNVLLPREIKHFNVENKLVDTVVLKLLCYYVARKVNNNFCSSCPGNLFNLSPELLPAVEKISSAV